MPRTPSAATAVTAAKAPRKAPPEVAIDLETLPGHQIRRLHQIAVAIFLQETGESGLTPVQYAALQAVANRPAIDQRTLSGLIGLDTSTLAGVIDRLEARGLVERKASAEDRRVKLVSPTTEGRAALAAALPAMLRAQDRILAPLSPADRQAFARMLDTLVTANNELSRAPSMGERRG